MTPYETVHLVQLLSKGRPCAPLGVREKVIEAVREMTDSRDSLIRTGDRINRDLRHLVTVMEPPAAERMPS